jgi:hypothetical protein
MQTLMQAIAGAAGGFLILMFIYLAMSEQQKDKFHNQSLFFEAVFFMAPFGLSFISGGNATVMVALGLGIGLSSFSLLVKTSRKASKAIPSMHIPRWTSSKKDKTFGNMTDKQIDSLMKLINSRKS